MSAPNLATVKAVRRWTDIAESMGLQFNIETSLILAIIAQESAGNPYAIRVERGFWRRYGSTALALFRRTPNRFDDKWGRYPDLASTSYGLMQVIYVTAVEMGMTLEFPTDLCNPATGVEAGCRYLRWCLRRTNNLVRAALQRYNGGGNAEYANEVIAWELVFTASAEKRGENEKKKDNPEEPR